MKILILGYSSLCKRKIIPIFKGHDAIIHLAYRRPKEIRNATNIENEINAFERENSNIQERYRLAKHLLQEGKTDEAWQILL